jgi:hypothetical protein
MPQESKQFDAESIVDLFLAHICVDAAYAVLTGAMQGDDCFTRILRRLMSRPPALFSLLRAEIELHKPSGEWSSAERMSKALELVLHHGSVGAHAYTVCGKVRPALL